MPGEVNMKAVRRVNFVSCILSTSSTFRRLLQLFNGNEWTEPTGVDPNAEGTCP